MRWKLGQPAIELGSGTGKILIPLLEQGLDVTGIDTSEDMTARCLATCAGKNREAEIHEQSMVEIDLPRRFRLIFLDSGGLGLFTEDRDIEATFQRVMMHLEPGSAARGLAGSVEVGSAEAYDWCEEP